jgi:transcriptional regulator with GAF, ATPase, and Fis domain
MWDFVDPLVISNNPVLIRGESGVRGDLIARAVHAASTRRGGPFVKVNCAAIPPRLLESHLFGHEEGPFLGTHRRKRGQFEYASKGTLYLEEVAKLPRSLQERLLHAMRDHRFSRVGGDGTIDVDAGVIASTNRDLEAAIGRGEFMEELYYRLAVVEFRVKPGKDEGSDDSGLDRPGVPRRPRSPLATGGRGRRSGSSSSKRSR